MERSKDISNIYLWFDTEFTTLELEKAKLLQIAMVATNAKLERILPVDEDINLIVKLDKDESPSPWVAENLSKLISRCRSPEAIPIAEADARIGRWLEKHFGPMRDDISHRPIIAGNSICCDWYLARRYLPALNSYTNYRILDISGWKVHWRNAGWGKDFDKDQPELVRKFFLGDFAGNGSQHDAYFDVQASIAEFNYYLQTLAPSRSRQTD